MVSRPLEGLRVADFTRFVAGAQATAMLAALGADVVKVEVPPGDPYRQQGADATGESPLFRSLNSGKRSLAVDFRSPSGADIIERLLASSHFMVENSRPGSLAKYALDWEAVHQRYPALVYGSITAYGDVGPDAHKGGYDLILQAEGGLMSVTGTPDSGPVKVGAPVLDVGAGLSCVVGLLAAQIERAATGMGRLVSSSLLEFSLACLGTVSASFMASGTLPGLLGTHSPTFAPYGGFQTADGWLVMAGAGSEQMWVRACAVLGLEYLVDDERFSDNGRRVRNRDELTRCIEHVLQQQPSVHWLHAFERAGVPVAEVANLGSVLEGAQVTALGAVQTLQPKDGGAYRVVGAPLRLDLKPATYVLPAPPLGGDTTELLKELQYSAADVDRLLSSGVVVAA